MIITILMFVVHISFEMGCFSIRLKTLNGTKQSDGNIGIFCKNYILTI